ncbi:hypothetical protein ACFFGV_10460 [Pontibacillus salicampi]|uniref:Uncharacterized protein n=1 Tax=Pontibacillus salicampi TaxID=1449801 RepID=A0ABV6LNL7_9BACI
MKLEDMEDVIRKAGGATDYEAIIAYPDAMAHIPSSYQYTCKIQGNKIVDTFENVNLDTLNVPIVSPTNK